jgi:hypothetical protein
VKRPHGRIGVVYKKSPNVLEKEQKTLKIDI